MFIFTLNTNGTFPLQSSAYWETVPEPLSLLQKSVKQLHSAGQGAECYRLPAHLATCLWTVTPVTQEDTTSSV